MHVFFDFIFVNLNLYSNLDLVNRKLDESIASQHPLPLRLLTVTDVKRNMICFRGNTNVAPAKFTINTVSTLIQ